MDNKINNARYIQVQHTKEWMLLCMPRAVIIKDFLLKHPAKNATILKVFSYSLMLFSWLCVYLLDPYSLLLMFREEAIHASFLNIRKI